MVRADDRTLEQAPDILQRVCMNDSPHVLMLKVTDRSVKRVFVCDALIAAPFVGDYEPIWLAYFILLTVPWFTGRSLTST